MKRVKQMTFGEPDPVDISAWIVDSFSAGSCCQDFCRKAIEEKYSKITDVTSNYNRQSVSYQLSKNDTLHSWLKYKEGFSAELVENLLEEMNLEEGSTVMDPFMGSGTTNMVCRINGINSIGFDILPTSELSIRAKQSVLEYDVRELETILDWIANYKVPGDYQGTVNEIGITKGAYPDKTNKEISYVSEQVDGSNYSENAKLLVKLCILNSLERSSYTSKDGQYLAWDYRSQKCVSANAKRELEGKKISVRLDKGQIPEFRTVLLSEMSNVIKDIRKIQSGLPKYNSELQFISGSVLFKAPELGDGIIDGVITSPPYCNRYDYTRTYALELVYLGLSEKQLSSLRQELLSCTVENKSKRERLKDYYESIGKIDDFNKITDLIDNNDVLNEIDDALKYRLSTGEINNKSVLRMVHDYFSDLTFVYYELYRLCKSGAKVAFVNDNVRYAGEVIPVDYLSTYIAETIGFKPEIIHTLHQQKGNSSQQMKKYGRVPLRKSITIWSKP